MRRRDFMRASAASLTAVAAGNVLSRSALLAGAAGLPTGIAGRSGDVREPQLDQLHTRSIGIGAASRWRRSARSSGSARAG